MQSIRKVNVNNDLGFHRPALADDVDEMMHGRIEDNSFASLTIEWMFENIIEYQTIYFYMIRPIERKICIVSYSTQITAYFVSFAFDSRIFP